MMRWVWMMRCDRKERFNSVFWRILGWKGGLGIKYGGNAVVVVG